MITCYCESCGWRISVSDSIVYRGPCDQCGADVSCGSGSGNTRNIKKTRAEIKPKPVPYDAWPRWAKQIAKRRTGDERGVGDTVYRYSQRMGGERFKRTAEALGIPCGCTARQERWNKLYPYGDIE